jgi:hypothetical protein
MLRFKKRFKADKDYVQIRRDDFEKIMELIKKAAFILRAVDTQLLAKMDKAIEKESK